MPVASVARPSGEAKRALLPVASTDPPTFAPPAKVVPSQSDPEGAIFRMVLLTVSARYKFPFLSRVSPKALLKRAANPGPSFVPGAQPAQPATVVTIQFVPTGAILR